MKRTQNQKIIKNNEIKKRIIKTIREIELKTDKLVNTLMHGSFRSIFLGNGLDFSDLRNYMIGDDIRFIDWKASSRTDELLIKKYTEERESVYHFVFDYTKSMFSEKKMEFGLTLLASLMLYCAKTNNSFYLTTFGKSIKMHGRFKTINDVNYLIGEIVDDIIENAENILNQKEIELKEVLRKMMFTKYTHTVIISDFIFDDFEKELNELKTNDLIGLQILSDAEIDPKPGVYALDKIKIIKAKDDVGYKIKSIIDNLKRSFLKKEYKFYTLNADNDVYYEIRKIIA